MWGGGRKFSTLKKRLSFTAGMREDDQSPPSLLKARLRKSRPSNSNNLDRLSDDSGPTSVNRHKRGQSQVSVKSSKSFIPQEIEPMPSVEEVEEQFEITLEEMAIPEGNKDKLRQQEAVKKWEIIQAQRRLRPGRNTHSSGDVKSAGYWIRKIKERDSRGKPRITPKDALSMESVFRTSHREFISEFLEGYGVKEMNRLTDYFTNKTGRKREEVEVLGSLIEAYRLLMNTELGMRGVLLVPGSIKSIAMSMDFLGEQHHLTEKVVLLLSVTCWWDEEGRKKVMEAMRYLKARFKEISLFQTVVYLFEHGNDPGFKANIATFITTVVNTPPTIEERVGVRNLFFRLDIINVFENVLAKAPEDAMLDDGPWNAMQTQYQVFVAMMREDQKEIVHKLIAAADADASHFDLSNLHDSWKILQRNALKADAQDQLLNIVQALFLVPTVHTLAVPIFESIAKYIFEATSVDKLQLASGEKVNLAEAPSLNFEELGKLLKRKVEYNARVEVFEEKEGLVKRLKKLVGVLQKRLMDVATGYVPAIDALDLQETLIENQLMKPPTQMSEERKKQIKISPAMPMSFQGSAPNSATGGSIALLAGLGLVDSANEIEIMKEREAKMKAEIDNLQKQVDILSKGGKIDPSQLKSGGTAPAAGDSDPITGYKGKLDSTGLVPAGIAPGKTKKDPPPVPKSGMPGSLENAPIAVEAAPVKAKGEANAGGQGGLAAMFANRAAAMPKKPKVDKKQKIRAALEKLGLPDKPQIQPSVKMTQVFWNVIAPDALEGTVWPELSDQTVNFDATELEMMFGKQDAGVKKGKTKKKEVDENELIKLIDSQRRQNLAIALRKVKMGSGMIKAAIVEADTEIISREAIQVFIDTCPTTDELTLLEKYVKDGSKPEKLEQEEQYLFELSQIPSLETRLKCMKTTFTFSGDAKRIASVISRMKKALKEVNNSKELRQILEIVLAIGNYMNGGTARGAAWGFKLDILGNLGNVKDANNNGTLMHYIYALFEKNYPHLCEFSLPKCAAVVDINFKEAVKEMNTLAKQISALKQEVKKKPFAKADKFRKRFSPFEVKASKDIENLQKHLEQVRGDFHNLALTFAEKGNDVEPCTMFPKLVAFEQDLSRAGGQLKLMRENEARKLLLEEKKQERIAYRKLKLLVEKTKDDEGNLDMGLIQAYKQSQKGKANQVVDRFLEKYKRDQEKQNKRRQKSKNRQLDD